MAVDKDIRNRRICHPDALLRGRRRDLFFPLVCDLCVPTSMLSVLSCFAFSGC